ncbi:MAG TPA: SDR family NAD(P)-dependent oxidoreductase [Bryobacteraceae bacterium]|nr:SDR family NAD(P)-dependent oxidoreductase [Bryobacteraceae bacterium]
MARPVALVTGASSGLGETFARALAKRGFDLILVARREEKLRALAAALPVDSEIIVADLATDEGVAAAERAIVACDRLEVLVNNAGFGTVGRFWIAEEAGQEAMHRVHVLATVKLTHAALRGMVARGKGGVINVSSVAAFGQNQGNVSYCATKAWMNSFTLGLDAELKGVGSKVRVQALCPGFTETDFHGTLFHTSASAGRAGVAPFLWLKANDVVEASLGALENGRGPIVVPDWKYKIAVLALKLLPGALTRGVRPGNDKRV